VVGVVTALDDRPDLDAWLDEYCDDVNDDGIKVVSTARAHRVHITAGAPYYLGVTLSTVALRMWAVRGTSAASTCTCCFAMGLRSSTGGTVPVLWCKCRDR